MIQIIYLALMITIQFKATQDPEIHQKLQGTLEPYQTKTEGYKVRIDVAEDFAYEVVGSQLSREFRAEIEAALIGRLGAMGMAFPPVMSHIDMGEF